MVSQVNFYKVSKIFNNFVISRKQMSNIKIKVYLFKVLYFFIMGFFISCIQKEFQDNNFLVFPTFSLVNSMEVEELNSCNLGINAKALLSSRFKNLAHLKTIVSIQYDKDYTKMDSNSCSPSIVHLSYMSNGEKIIRTMTSGASQAEIMNLQKADYFTCAKFVLAHPNVIRQRKELTKIHVLARRKPDILGPRDMSFYDLAESSVSHINTPNLAFQNTKDRSERGYINTFNHVAAQAIITSFFSEGLADLIGDLHERQNMPEITSGRFTERQLNDSINNPEDNYVDIINNEIGQKIGLKLKYKYKLSKINICTPVLLAAYLNDIQSYYMWAMEIGLDPFRSTDDVVIKFTKKINIVLLGSYKPYTSNFIK